MSQLEDGEDLAAALSLALEDEPVGDGPTALEDMLNAGGGLPNPALEEEEEEDEFDLPLDLSPELAEEPAPAVAAGIPGLDIPEAKNPVPVKLPKKSNKKPKRSPDDEKISAAFGGPKAKSAAIPKPAAVPSLEIKANPRGAPAALKQRKKRSTLIGRLLPNRK